MNYHTVNRMESSFASLYLRAAPKKLKFRILHHFSLQELTFYHGLKVNFIEKHFRDLLYL